MGNTLRIIHAADLHLDSPFEALGEKAARRRAEQRALLERIAALARQRRAQLLLLAGDLLDTGGAYAETGRTLCSALSGAGCPVFIAPGNHDWYGTLSPYARLELPENVHVFKTAAMSGVELSALGARVWGAAFTDNVSPPLLRGFHAERKPGFVNIGVLHGEAGAPDSRYNPITEEEIAASGLDYLALGHVHTCGGLRRAGDVFYAWPGCPEGRGFDECGEKGVLYLELGEGECRAEFVPLEGRRYEIVRVDMSRPEPLFPDSGGRDIVRLILTGETETAPDTRALYEALHERFFSLQIYDRTTLRRDLWEQSEQDSLRGLFLRRMRGMYDAAADEDERQRIIFAVRWGLAALDGGEEPAGVEP